MSMKHYTVTYTSRLNYTVACIMYSTHSSMSKPHKNVDKRKTKSKGSKWYESIGIIFYISETGNTENSQKRVKIISI